MDRDYWDSQAEGYERNLLEIVREDQAGALSEELAALGGPERRVADLGCGPGSLLPLLVRHFREVIAVDYAKQLLDLARQRCRSPKVSYACCDLSRGQELPFRVEVACCINALIDPVCRKRHGMLRSLRSVLEPGGTSVIVVPALESVFHVYHTLMRIRERSGRPHGLSRGDAERALEGEMVSFAEGVIRVGGVPTKYWMCEELTTTLEDHGLRPRRVRRVEYPWTEEIEHAPGWLEGQGPWDWLVVCEA